MHVGKKMHVDMHFLHVDMHCLHVGMQTFYVVLFTDMHVVILNAC
jgi:hypothetical protein